MEDERLLFVEELVIWRRTGYFEVLLWESPGRRQCFAIPFDSFGTVIRAFSMLAYELPDGAEREAALAAVCDAARVIQRTPR